MIFADGDSVHAPDRTRDPWLLTPFRVLRPMLRVGLMTALGRKRTSAAAFIVGVTKYG